MKKTAYSALVTTKRTPRKKQPPWQVTSGDFRWKGSAPPDADPEAVAVRAQFAWKLHFGPKDSLVEPDEADLRQGDHASFKVKGGGPPRLGDTVSVRSPEGGDWEFNTREIASKVNCIVTKRRAKTLRKKIGDDELRDIF